MTKAIKSHDGKPRLDLVPADALKGMAKVLEVGAQKNGRKEHDWRKGTKWEYYIGAMLRHAIDFSEGMDIDPEDGLPLIDKVLTNAAILSHYQKNAIGEDGRPNKEGPHGPGDA